MNDDFPKPHPDSIIYEDSKLYACLANDAVALGQVVVVWKKDVEDLHYLSERDYIYLMEKVDEIRDAMLLALNIEKVYLVYMDEAKHVHWHLIPRYDKKGYNIFLDNPVKVKDYSLAKKIMGCLDQKITIYFIKAGETFSDKKGILLGQSNSSLTVVGRSSAYTLAKKLKDKKIDLIYSSDLDRARECADIISEKLGIPMETTEILRERNLGTLNGKPLKLVNEVLNLSNSAEVAPSGESFDQMKSRVLSFLESLCDLEYKTIVIVTHDGPLRAMLSEYLGTEILDKKCNTNSNEIYKLDLHR